MQEFNQEILETMEKQVKNIKSIYEVCEYCRNGNKIANEEYIKHYPTHKDLLAILETAVIILELNIINDYEEDTVENALHDIDFIICQNVLTEAHIKRSLLGPYTLQGLPIFKKKIDSIREIIINLYNCESSQYYYEYDEYKATLPFNYQQLESYMRYNKVGYEEELINQDMNGDYLIEHVEIHFDIDSVNKVNEAYDLDKINLIDKFRLEQHGLKPIEECCGQFIHYKNGKTYNLYKKNDYYYMITESNNKFKSYKIKVEDKESNLTLESLYGGKWFNA